MRVTGAKSNSIHFVNSLVLFLISIIIPREISLFDSSRNSSFLRSCNVESIIDSIQSFFFSFLLLILVSREKGKVKEVTRISTAILSNFYIFWNTYRFKGKYIFYLFIERDLGKFKNVGGNNGTFVRARWNFYEIFRIKNTSLNNKFFLLIVIRVILWIFPIPSRISFLESTINVFLKHSQKANRFRGYIIFTILGIDHRKRRLTVSLSLDYFPALRLNYARVVDESRAESSWKECGRIKGEGSERDLNPLRPHETRRDRL